MDKRMIRTMAIAVLCLAVVGLSIGFAYIAQDVEVEGTGLVKGNNFTVIFQNITHPTSQDGTLIGDATITTPASITGDTVFVFAVQLSKPGDKVVYTFDVKNVGSLDAKVRTFSLIGLSTADELKFVSYTLTYADGTPIVAEQTLDVNAVKTLKLTLEYLQPADNTLLASDINLDLGAVIEYQQK